MKKIGVTQAVWRMLLDQWQEEEWSVHWYLQPNKKNPKLLATPDTDTKVVHLYPHPVGIPPEKTGLHEMIHIRFNLSGEDRDEEVTYCLEEWLWRRLNAKQKEALHNIFVAPLKANGNS